MPATRDLVRQIAVISAFCFMIIAAMVGTGLFGGTPVQDLQEGALDADGSYLAPARPAFSIWTVIYVGLFAYTVWQAFPAQRGRDRQRALGWLIAGTMVLNGLWLVTAQFATLPLTVLAIIVLLVLLGVTFRRAVVLPGRGIVDAMLIDGVTGLHLGWVALATVANTAAWLTRVVPESWGEAATTWGIAVLIVVALIGVAIAWASGWRIAPGLAMAWGLTWVGVGRLAFEPANAAIGITAFVAAGVVLLVPLVGMVLRWSDEVRNAE
ncbi:tryptophan-rich sensory protein [Microbacterium sp. CFH 90308]|uniref:Tryptophan-rich sensory protein n=1 Tax=Microbacterium salsuginis TaxID=2722803 RepID=A0ABX1KDR9_9MICO|nr:tryptophan-rich sensory protein [Microbacterium sp. CFH 90308]NLP84468.1 tryptophan-rich sensory protein [Microbacterium sp. CFH 90308]